MLPINKKRQYFVPLIVIEYWLREDVQDGTAFLRQHGINLRGRNLQAYFDITVGFDEWCGLVEGTLNAPGFAEGFSRNLANGYMLTLLPRWHVIGYYNTIGDAFKYIAYYFEISSVVPMRLREAGNSLRLEFSATQLGDGVRRHNFLRMMTMRQVVLNSLVSPIPIRVATSVKPTDAAMFVDVFSYTPEFCDQDYIEIDRANADHLFVFANERTRSLLMQLVKQCDYQARLSSDISETVLAVIENRLGHAAVSVDAIADDLGIGVRTLQRRLQSKGVRFASLLDVARQNMHQTLLAEGRHSAGQIAAALGYHDTNSFYRARSRWRSDAAE